MKEKDRGDKDTAPRAPIIITSLETKNKGRPLLLGEELDAAVQEFVNNLRSANGVVNRLVVMGAAEGIIPIMIFLSCLHMVDISRSQKAGPNHYSTEWGSLKESVQHLGRFY